MVILILIAYLVKQVHFYQVDNALLNVKLLDIMETQQIILASNVILLVKNAVEAVQINASVAIQTNFYINISA